MAEIRLTEEQTSAVENRGGRLLVSAAAGSGKTKVLIERLFSYVMQGADVDQFLMITYTKAAAAELRGKIAAELTGRVAADPENQHLRRQLFRIYQSDIKTVDAFCVSLLRENTYQIKAEGAAGLTPDFRVLDEQEAVLMKNRVLERVLENFYANMGESGSQLADTLGAGRDDKKLQELVLELHEKLQSHPYPLQWLEEARKNWEQLPTTLADSSYGKILLEEVVRKASFWAEKLRSAVPDMEGNEKLYAGYADRFLETAEQLERYAEAAERGWAEAAAIHPAFRRMGRVPECPEKAMAQSILELCKKELKKLEEIFSVDEEIYLRDMAAIAPSMLALMDLTSDFTHAYQTEKVRRNCMDFSDQEHYAITLLWQDGHRTDLARRVAERYTEILVDEYQDSNAVQDCIFSAISKDEKNLFTVGDVKQSIYRFRLADPTIFLRAYLHYADVSAAKEEEPRRVLLSRNFRSRQEVLQSTNFVFCNIMSREMGEMDYGPREQLHYGAEYYLPRTDCAAEFHFISVEDTPEESFRTAAVEADFVARRIRDLLDSGFPVQEGDGFRPCVPEDIVLLMRSPKNRLQEFTHALRQKNIPCASEENGDFFATVEISALFSFLQVIDNPHQDIPLISTLRSPLFGFSPDRLAEIRSRGKGDFYEALCNDENRETVRFLQILHKLREEACEKNADELVWYLYDLCHALAVFGAMEGGAERRQNLLTFYTYAGEMVHSGKKSLFDFVNHLRSLLERGDAPTFSTGDEGGGVRIMSIHKSKGLEFPIVILCDLQHRFNTKDMTRPVLVHPELGLGAERVDNERSIRYDTISRMAVQRRLTRESKAEEMRILYVAMTRAREKLIMVYCTKDARKRVQDLSSVTACPVPAEAVANARCMGDWVMLPLLASVLGAPLRRLAELPAENLQESPAGWEVHLWENPKSEETLLCQNGEKEKTQPELELDVAMLEGVYPYQNAVSLPTKVTATQLKGRSIDEELAEGAASRREYDTAFERPRFMQQKGLTPTERGTAIHSVMQYLDFEIAPTVEAVREQIAEMGEKRLLTPEQQAVVEPELILDFLQSELCRRIRNARKIYREYCFSVNVPAQFLKKDAPQEEEVMLQGVVDCAFETEQGLVIVDFKTDRVVPSGERERAESYRPQLEAYSYALSRVLEQPIAEKILYFFHTNSTINL